jgi:hypothetical protein
VKFLDFGIGIPIPIDAATSTFAILAKRRVGKSNTAVVMAETFYAAGIPFLAIDPKGDWYGVRADGPTLKGLKVVIFGGLHADVPLESSQGAFIAELVAQERISCVLDVSEFSEGEKNRFLTDFALKLLKVNRSPLHCFFEEADDYIPQKPFREQARTVGAFQKLVKNGGFRGIGCTLITHRSAVISKNVLNQTETLIIHRTTAPADQKAVGLWFEHQAVADQILDTLSTLDNGEAWVVSPHFLGLEAPVRVLFPRRGTFDSGDTPRVGGRAKRAKSLADIDIEGIRLRMKETIERAKADDPRELKARIAELEKELKRAKLPAPQRTFMPVEVKPPKEIQVIKPKELDRLARYIDALSQRQQVVVSAIENLQKKIELARKGAAEPRGGALMPLTVNDRIKGKLRLPDQHRVKITATLHGPKQNGESKLPKGAREMLVALATMNKPLSVAEVAALSGVPPRSSTMRNYRSMLKVGGLVDVLHDGRLEITQAGTAVLGSEPIRPKTAREMFEFWMPKLPEGARRMIQVLRMRHASSDDTTRAELGAEAGIDPASSTFRNYMSMLKVRGLIVVSGDAVSVNPDLYLGGE